MEQCWENVIFNEDCNGKNGMAILPDSSINMVLSDFPYGDKPKNGKSDWDKPLDLETTFDSFDRVCTDSAPIILFANIKLASELIQVGKNFRYDIVWDKGRVTGHLNSSRMPLRQHELILVFYKKLPTYNPLFKKGEPLHGTGIINEKRDNTYGDSKILSNNRIGSTEKYPSSILKFDKKLGSHKHPTEKPIDLLAALIYMFSNQGDVVLDPCAGACGVPKASRCLNRKYVAFENDKKYGWFDKWGKHMNDNPELDYYEEFSGELKSMYGECNPNLRKLMGWEDPIF